MIDTSQPIPPDEERILISQLAQNPNAFRQLYQHYFPRVFAYVAYRVGTKQEAEDLTATTFMKVIEAISRFEYRRDRSFALWIFRIAHNEVQQFYRLRQRRPTVLLDDVPEIASVDFLPDEAFARKEQFVRLQHMLATLTPRRQEIISLRFFAGLRNQEIAAVLALDERTVASHLCRALEDLKQLFESEEAAYEPE
ncbi:MAG: sigma-70 family RNA polymerase sigma factor [Anaerolineae bacterium]